VKSLHPLRTLSCCAVLLAALVTGGTARAGQVSKFKLSDHALIGQTFTVDECHGVATFVRFAESVVQTDGPPVTNPPLTSIEISYVNSCTGEVLTFSGGTNTQTVSIANDLGSASLSAVVPVSSDTGTANVLVNLTWTANGPLQEAKDHFKTEDGNTMTHEKFDFKVRNADVGGTLTATLPTADGPVTLNLGEINEGGTIGKDVVGTRQVTKKH
jgi:hypothetical protein